MNVEETVRKIVSSKASLEKVNKDTQLPSLGFNSLDLVEITLEIEDVFNISFTSGEIASLKTVNDLISLIKRKTK